MGFTSRELPDVAAQTADARRLDMGLGPIPFTKKHSGVARSGVGKGTAAPRAGGAVASKRHLRQDGRVAQVYGNALPEFLGNPDEKSFRATDVAQPIRVLVLNHVADKLRTELTESDERLVNVVHREHGA